MHGDTWNYFCQLVANNEVLVKQASHGEQGSVVGFRGEVTRNNVSSCEKKMLISSRFVCFFTGHVMLVLSLLNQNQPFSRKRAHF